MLYDCSDRKFLQIPTNVIDSLSAFPWHQNFTKGCHKVLAGSKYWDCYAYNMRCVLISYFTCEFLDWSFSSIVPDEYDTEAPNHVKTTNGAHRLSHTSEEPYRDVYQHNSKNGEPGMMSVSIHPLHFTRILWVNGGLVEISTNIFGNEICCKFESRAPMSDLQILFILLR